MFQNPIRSDSQLAYENENTTSWPLEAHGGAQEEADGDGQQAQSDRREHAAERTLSSSKLTDKNSEWSNRHAENCKNGHCDGKRFLVLQQWHFFSKQQLVISNNVII